MKLTTLAGAAATHAKSLAVLSVIAAAGTTGGIVANTVANSHASTHLATVGMTRGGESTGGDRAHGDAREGSHDDSRSHMRSRVTSVSCASVRNHGDYVSGVARSTRHSTAWPELHGRTVSAAARSSCGIRRHARSRHEASERDAHHGTAGRTERSRWADGHAHGGHSGTEGHSGTSHATGGHGSGRSGD